MVGLLIIIPLIFHDTLTVIDEVVIKAKAEPISLVSGVMEIPDTFLKTAESPDEVINHLTGVYVSYGGKTGADVMIRGFDTREIVIMVDGVPVVLPYDGTFDISQLPMSDLEKIKVFRGVGADVFGPNAMGGVINFVTTSPFHRYRRVSIGLGRNLDKFLNFTYSAQAGRLGFLLSGGYSKSDGYYLSDDFKPDLNEDGGIRENSWYEKKNLRFKVGYNSMHLGKFFFNAGLVDNSRGVPIEVGTSRPRYWKFPVWREKILKFSHEIVGSKLITRTNIYYQGFYNILESYRDSTFSTLKWKSIYDDYSVGGNVYFDFPDATLGLTMKKDVHREKKGDDEPWVTYDAYNGSIGFDMTFRTLAGNFAPGFNVSFMKAEGADRSSMVTLNPSAGWTDAFGNLRLKASVAVRSRFPTLKELFSSRMGRYYPNPDLRPERAINFDFGGTYLYGGIEIGVNLFDSEVKDLIDRVKVDRDHYQMQNINRARYSGVEFSLSHEIVRLNYTYLKAKNLSEDREFDFLEYRPEHKLTFDLTLTPWNLFEVRTSIQYVGKRYYIFKDEYGELDPYTLVNVETEKRLGNFSLLFKVKNLFDVSYESEKGYPMPGRYWKLVLTVNLD